MSVPKDILDSLLSAYMDDALSADERTRVDQMLRDDASVVSELEQLKQLRQSLQQIRDEDRNVKLPANFAQSVIEATVARGRAEGLSDDHPVMRLSEQPSPMVTRERTSVWRIVAPLAAIAASLAIAFFATRPGVDVDPVALINPEVDKIATAEDLTPTATPETASNPNSAAADPGAAMIVDASGGNKKDIVANSDAVASANVPSAIATPGPDGVGIEKVDQDPSNQDTGNQDTGNQDTGMKIAAVSPIAKAVGPNAAVKRNDTKPAAADVVAIKAMLVLDVRRTMDGRNTRSVESAMELAGIDTASRKAVDENVVRFANENKSDNENASSASVLYLEAPAKQLDQFILRLIADEQGIESVSMTIANDPPLVAMIQSLRDVDPTTVTHSTSWQLDAGANGTNALASHLSDRPYVRLNSATANMAVAGSVNESGSASTSSDIIGRVLVIVR
ncbi:anti-sigma factor family protein [Novipirellula sp. SH528]|uniref:anti-sigma factor family protein n=1 Tax=Novipirellula sp. SH528 TaxID=3454466 RepID=UPI003FA16499